MDYLVKIRSVQTPLNGQFSIGANMHLSNLDDGLYLLFLYPVFFVPFVDYAFLLGTCVTSVLNENGWYFKVSHLVTGCRHPCQHDDFPARLQILIAQNIK